MGPTPPLGSHEHIHEGPDITVVDLEDCSAREVGSVYRVLTTRLTQGAGLRLALVPQTPRANAAFREIERQFKGSVIALRVFEA